MTRREVPGSVSRRRVIALRPSPVEFDLIQQHADLWACSLSEATLRLVRAGLQSPQPTTPDERTSVVLSLLQNGATRSDVTSHCSTVWGLNQRQSDQLIAQACALLQIEADQTRSQFLQDLLQHSTQINAALAAVKTKAVPAVASDL